MKKEAFYQRILEQHLEGSHATLRGFGITDITTNNRHAEIKNWAHWKQLVGQVLTYNFASPRPELQAYFFGDIPKNVEQVVAVCQNYNIKVFHLQDREEYVDIMDPLTKTILSTIHVSIPRPPPKQPNITPEHSVTKESKNDASRFECLRCGTTFDRKAHLHMHISRKKQCEPRKSNLTLQEVGEQYGLNPQVFECTTCLKQFATKHRLDSHVNKFVCRKVELIPITSVIFQNNTINIQNLNIYTQPPYDRP